MRKKSLMKVAGFALATSLAFTGCGDSGGVPELEGGGIVGGTGGAATTTGGVTGGATTGGATAGTTGVGLTGGSMAGTFGGGTGGAAGGGGVATTAGGGAAAGTTDGAAAGTTGTPVINNFLDATSPTVIRASLDNPTVFTELVVGGVPRVFIVDGFQLGSNNGRVFSFDSSAGASVVQEILPNADSTASAALTNPFDIVTDGTDLFVSVGMGSFQEGGIIRISNITDTGGVLTGTFEDLTDTAVTPINPAYMTLARQASGQTFLYWTEYAAASGSGQVRRVPTDGSGPVEVIINNLNFPLGIDHNGIELAVCDTAGGGGGNGRVILAPLAPAGILDGQSLTDVTLVEPAAGEIPIIRPFDIGFDFNNGFFFTEGAALPIPTAPVATGPGGGAVRFIPSNSATATIVNSGLTNVAGLDAVDSNGDGITSLLFSESIDSTGTVLKRIVDTNAIVQTLPTTVDSGLFSPLTVGILGEFVPEVLTIINFDGGQGNGTFTGYAP